MIEGDAEGVALFHKIICVLKTARDCLVQKGALSHPRRGVEQDDWVFLQKGKKPGIKLDE